MEIAFLNPLFLSAGAMIAVPIWLHLRRSDEADAFLLPTTRFLEASKVTAPASRRVEDWLGLLLRILALMLTVLSLAWPYRRADRSGVIHSRVVCILDNTLSHSAGGAFLRARDRMASDIEGFGPEVRVAVIELKSHPELVGDFDLDRGSLLGSVRALEPSAERGKYVSAFMRAAALLENGGLCERQIRFYTDNQANQWAASDAVTGFLKGTSVVLVGSEVSMRDNLAVTVGAVDRVHLGERSQVQVEVSVRRFVGSDRADAAKTGESVRVQLVVGGEVVAEEAVALSESEKAGAAKLKYELNPAEAFIAQIRVVGNRDALAGDSVAWTALPPVREGSVEVAASAKFLRAAFSEDVLKGFWNVAERMGVDVAGANLPVADVLVLDERELGDVTKLTRLSSYLNGGRGVLLFAGGDGSLTLRALMGLGIEVRGVRQVSEPAKLGLASGRHSVARAMRAGEYRGFGEVAFARLNVFDVPSSQACLLTASGETVVQEVPVARGRLMVVGSGFEGGDSDWPTHVSFIPFLDACMSALKISLNRVVQAKPGDDLIIPDQLVPRGVACQLVGAGLSVPVENRDRAMALRVPSKAGVFRLEERLTGEPLLWICVNGDELESNLAVSGTSGVPDGWMIPGTRPAGVVQELQPMMDRDAILRQAFGRMLLLFAAVYLMLEPLTHALRRRVR